MSKWLQDTLAWMRTLPRHEPDGAALGGYEGPPATEVRYHHVQHGEPARPPEPTLTPAPTPARGSIPIDEVKRMVAAKRREMQAEREAAATLRRIRNEDARVFKYLRQVPVTDGYKEALACLHSPEPEVDIYKDGPVPNGYSIALAKRGISPEVWEPTGDEPPDGYAIALAKRRKEA